VATFDPQTEIREKTALDYLEQPDRIPKVVEIEEPKAKSSKDDGFVFGLEGSGLVRQKGKVAYVIEDDSLETQPYQVAIVTTTLTAHALFAAFSIAEVFSAAPGAEFISLLKTVLTVLSSFAIADLGSGILHWSVDNYGNGRTPIMGTIIAAFQGHHSAPWTITERSFCNNVYKLCTPFGIPTVALISLLTGPLTTLFFATFCVMEIMSQEFHKWSHMSKKECSPAVNWLQKIGFMIGRVPHSKHHTAPYEGKYCIVSGLCNDMLDNSGFFRLLEHTVYKINGIEANSWKLDPKLRLKTLGGNYKLDPKLRR